MSVRDAIQQVLEPIYVGETVRLRVSPDTGLTYDIDASTWTFRLSYDGATVLEVTSTPTADGGVESTPGEDYVDVVLDNSATADLVAGRRYNWTLAETVGDEPNVVAAGNVSARHW